MLPVLQNGMKGNPARLQTAQSVLKIPSPNLIFLDLVVSLWSYCRAYHGLRCLCEIGLLGEGALGFRRSTVMDFP